MSGPDDSTRPFWVLATLFSCGIVALIALLSWQLHWDWISNLWFNYAWSSDKGNGPEAIQQTIIYAAIAVVLIPPIRKAIERFAKRHVDSIKAHAAAEHDALHEKLDHIIHHSGDIPNKPTHANDWKERPKI